MSIKPSAYNPKDDEKPIPGPEFEPFLGRFKLSPHFEKVDCDICGDFVALYKCKDCGIPSTTIEMKKSESDNEESNDEVETLKAIPVYMCEDCFKKSPAHKESKHSVRSTIKLSGDELEREANEFLYPAVDIHSEFLKTLVDSEPRWMEEAVDVIMRNRIKVQENFEKNLEKWVKECTDQIEEACDKKYEEIKNMHATAQACDVNLGKLRRFQAGYEDSSEDGNISDAAYEQFLQNEVIRNALEINQYTPNLGPFFKFDNFDGRLVKLAKQFLNHEIVYEQMDVFQILSKEKGMKGNKNTLWNHKKHDLDPIEPNMSKIYDMERVLGNHQHKKLFCFPLILFPRPDYFTSGLRLKRQMDLLITTACRTGNLRKIKDPDDLTQRFGIHYKNGFGKRFLLRRINDQIFPALNERDWYRIDIRGWGLKTAADFEAKLDELKIQISEWAKETFEKERDRKRYEDPFCQKPFDDKRKNPGFSIIENGTEMPNFVVRMRNRRCYALILAFLKKGQEKIEYEKDGEDLVFDGPYAGWTWKTFTTLALIYVDDFEASPVELPMDNKDPFKSAGGIFYHLDGLLSDLDVPPLVLEGWIDLRPLANVRERASMRLLSERVRDCDVRALMRIWLVGNGELTVRFRQRVYEDYESAWFVKVQLHNDDGEDYMSKLDFYLVGHEKN
ncbi:unnamed protein product [Oikopleura dioica]|uniref:Uncharacterized protein n=1 Tax=Oikopleura dioica TaxID=34765 RepID=E4Y8V1_OIKDI|nr:unnamed protein product [Oikopleura dioica]